MPIESPLDVTTTCPLDTACAVCGATSRLRRTTYDGEIGVYCRTVCSDCILGGRRPLLSPGLIKLAILSHCDHLGLPAEQMVTTHYGEERAGHERYAEAVRTGNFGRDETVRLTTPPVPPTPEQWRRIYEGRKPAPDPDKGA